jgi:hypothetical protein
MKTNSKTDSVRAARMEAAPLRPTGSKKAKGETSHCDVRIAGQVPALTHEQIAERARAIWIERGRIVGEDERNWREAEAQLRGELGLKHPSL